MKYIHKAAFPTRLAQFEAWLQGWGEMLDGLVTLFSFGIYNSSFEFRICAWRTLRQIKRQKEAAKNG